MANVADAKIAFAVQRMDQGGYRHLPIVDRDEKLTGIISVRDIMRYLMYARCYGELDKARSQFRKLPPRVRNHMAELDFKEAERKCPQRIDIGRLMREAATELA